MAVLADLAAAARDPAAHAVPLVLAVAVAVAVAAVAVAGDADESTEFNNARTIRDRLERANGRTECRDRLHGTCVATSAGRRSRCGNTVGYDTSD